MSAGDRRLRILDLLATPGPDGRGARRLCDVCAEVTGADGAGIMLMTNDVPQGSVCTTDELSALVEDLQFTLGEGPCVDAHSMGRPVSEARLADPHGRWPAFTPIVVEAGARAIFGFPLQVGALRLGAMNLYRVQPGRLTDDQHADALVMAAVAAQSVLAMQAEAPPGTLGRELEAGADFQYVVHQATGMVAAQLGISVTSALLRLRAFAFANGRLIRQVAEDVVDRRLRFDGAGDPRTTGMEE